ncbi:syntenin-1-like [Diorhabda carinulata]|uniref:syntenin-1-like n=1 Tax=Diorhabda carinulata TaxID=1163345 RepID=UPI0025A2F57E|nr:syntenin-1-like [Diorhabda carinulata]XP_057654858.1 syntenin-1-like [Diorhabda carinulata]
MSLYPSLEDMKVDQMANAQYNQIQRNIAAAPASAPPPYNYPNFNSMPIPAIAAPDSSGQQLYPHLGEYMGLELSEAVIAENMPEYTQVALQQQNVPQTTSTGLIAPISGQSVGLKRAQITHGVRQLILCKDKDGKVGVRVKAINKGIFVSIVVDKSPAALAGLRFGDQILQINDENVAGYSMDKVHSLFKKSPVNGIKVTVRDRPFERTLTLHKDSVGCLGFQFKHGKITTIVKDSSAARNGVLIDHQLLEIDGQNVVGLKDKEIANIIQKAGPVVTVTVIPCFLYDHMIKSMSGSLIKDIMDHSIPSV